MKTISRPAEGYPIDSYYLMDFSYSMKDDLENLKLLAGNLTEEFRRVSEDFTIGISSRIDFLFIDKLLIVKTSTTRVGVHWHVTAQKTRW